MNAQVEIETVAAGPNLVVLRVRGRLDARGAALLAGCCADARRQNKHLVLNLSGVSFIASSGVGALLALVEEYRQSRWRVRLAEVSPAVDSVIRLLNLDQFLSIDATEADASSALEAA
ncbi:MAG: STAS domain-containing protein [Candidatus Eiseniibacteriota bacterium]